jgi:hypothetical protein
MFCFVFILVVFVLCLLCQMLPLSLDFPFLVAPLVFSVFILPLYLTSLKCDRGVVYVYMAG